MHTGRAEEAGRQEGGSGRAVFKEAFRQAGRAGKQDRAGRNDSREEQVGRQGISIWQTSRQTGSQFSADRQDTADQAGEVRQADSQEWAEQVGRQGRKCRKAVQARQAGQICQGKSEQKKFI
jgi:hypothetical protein